MDLHASLPVGDPFVARFYSSSNQTWLVNATVNALYQVPQPFGRYTSDVGSTGMKWTHSFYSYVYDLAAGGGGTLYVRTPWQDNESYGNCSPAANGTCVASAQFVNQADKLLKLDAGYLLIEDNGRLNWYLSAYHGPHPMFFLTRQTDPEERTIVNVTYATPTLLDGGPCPGDGTDSGIPYVHTVTAPTANLGWLFKYQELPVPASSGQTDCALTEIDLLQPGGGSGGIVNYAYVNNQAGLIQSVTGDAGMIVESYSYDGGFGRVQSNTVVSFESVDSFDRASTDTVEPAFFIDGGAVANICEPNTCCSSDPGNMYRRTLFFSDQTVGDGTGNLGAGAGYSQVYGLTLPGSGSGPAHSQQVMRKTDSCTNANACSAGSEYYGWLDKSGGAVCGQGQLAGFKNELGNWYVTTNQFVFPDAGPWASVEQVWEAAAFSRGLNPNINSTNPLETNTANYCYSTDYSVQHLHTATAPSVAQSGSTAGTSYRYSGDGGAHLEAMFRFGFTRDTSGNPQSRTIGTFYRSVRTCEGTSDELGRVVAIEGPCDVSDTNATACSTSPAPLTQLYYYPASTLNNNAGRLQAVNQYVGGCAGAVLTTTYDLYTAAGDPAFVTDTNDAGTTYVYGPDRNVTSKTIAGHTWAYAWEAGRLTSIGHPEGNFDVFCYHSNGSDSLSPCSAAAALTRTLQWKAKASDANANTWTERVVYSHWSNDALRLADYYDTNSGSPQLRREEMFDQNAEGKPTWDQTGADAGGFHEARAYDGADNLTRIGLGFNGAPAFCTTSGVPSLLCSWLSYDRANRLTQFDAFPAGTGGTSANAIRTCFDHDTQGNITRVSSGCDAGIACDFDGGLSTCSPAPNDYKYDDFGNVVEADLANTDIGDAGSRGWSRFTYDALGDLTQTLRSSGASVLNYYDTLGRLTSSQDGVYQLANLGYDSSGGVPSCGYTATPNTMGRLKWIEDSSAGKLWYAYDLEGHVVETVSEKIDDTNCLTTVYSYSDNGNVTSIQYPHGRTVAYDYGSGGNKDRVADVKATFTDGGTNAWGSSQTLVDGVVWEPYAGLRHYLAHNNTSGSTSRVEYMLGGSSTSAPADGGECSNTAPSVASSYDLTGALRSLRVSYGSTSSLGSGSGEIYKRGYTWAGDQIARIDSCYLNDNLPITEIIRSPGYPGYDGTQRLLYVSLPNLAATGGWQGMQAYLYDARSNKTRIYVDAYGSYYDESYSTAPHRPDLLLHEGSGSASPTLFYDGDGRVNEIALPSTSLTDFGNTVTLAYQAGDTYQSANISNTATTQTYSYVYDTFKRRTTKTYPTGLADHFYYDTGAQLLEDVGNYSLSVGAPYPVDDYVWLDGRPIAVVRGSLDATLTWMRDGTGTCTRGGVPAACDTYFIVTDHIGKPVLSLDSSRRITGVGEYEPFGGLNRSEWWWGTDWTYSGTAGDTYNTMTQRAHGMTTAFRTHYARFWTQNNSCGVDSITAYDNLNPGSPCGAPLSGHLGETWSTWCPTASNDAGYAQYTLDWHQHGTTCTNCRCLLGHGCACATNGPYPGFSQRDYEYQRYQSDAGASMYFPPLRFPGQYFDEETHLANNLNRQYAMVSGRYLQPEPLLSILAGPSDVYGLNGAPPYVAGGPSFLVSAAVNAQGPPTYAYALNNPISYYDDNGEDAASQAASQAAKQAGGSFLGDLLGQVLWPLWLLPRNFGDSYSESGGAQCGGGNERRQDRKNPNPDKQKTRDNQNGKKLTKKPPPPPPFIPPPAWKQPKTK